MMEWKAMLEAWGICLQRISTSDGELKGKGVRHAVLSASNKKGNVAKQVVMREGRLLMALRRKVFGEPYLSEAQEVRRRARAAKRHADFAKHHRCVNRAMPDAESAAAWFVPLLSKFVKLAKDKGPSNPYYVGDDGQHVLQHEAALVQFITESCKFCEVFAQYQPKTPAHKRRTRFKHGAAAAATAGATGAATGAMDVDDDADTDWTPEAAAAADEPGVQFSQ
eukprot:m.206222 g.206222  ORF g.206222 m.206222 type:complete len:223 (+) comp10119_c0_seq71:2315-2983(+)